MNAQSFHFLARAFVNVRRAFQPPSALLAAFALLGVTLSAPLGHAVAPKANTPGNHLDRDFGKVPLSFEPNQGQTDPQVQFLSRGQGYALFLTPGEAVLELQKVQGKKADTAKTLPAPAVLRMTLAGADIKAVVIGEQMLPGTANYFIGNDSTKWKKELPTYKRVAYAGVYPGVDLVYYGNQRELEYDFVVAPGADASKIAIQFTGASPVVDKTGDLVLSIKGEEARFHKPVVYQLDGDRKVTIAGSYQIADGKVGFALGNYDHSKPLVIDPILSYLTYIGGSTNDLFTAIAVDASGSAYIVGTTYSTDFPVKNAYQATNPHTIQSTPGAMFVSKFNPTGTALVYSTYLGSTEYTYGNGIALDASGNAYVGGYTTYGNYPTTTGAFQTICGGYEVLALQGTTDVAVRTNGCVGAGQGDYGGVLTKLNASGSALVYSTYLGGNNSNVITAVAVDSAGQAYVTGYSNANCGPGPYSPNSINPSSIGCQSYSNFPITTGSAQDSANQQGPTGGNTFAFLTKFTADGSALLYSSILGNSVYPLSSQSVPRSLALAIDASGNAYIGGISSDYLYTTTGAYQTTAGTATGARAFAAKFDTVAKKIVYSTYLTGTYSTSNVGEEVSGIATDSAGNAYVGGFTSECNFPTTAGAYQTQGANPASSSGTCNESFITKFNPTGTSLVWSTFLGNITAGYNYAVYLYGLTLGPDGSVYAAGYSAGAVPSVGGLYATGGNYGFVSRLSADGTKLLFATPLGSSTGTFDVPYAVAVDSSANIYFAGQSNSNALPVTSGAFQSTNKTPLGSNYAYTSFVGKIAPLATTTTALTLPTGTVTAGQSVKFSAKVTGQTGSTGTPTGTVTFLSGSTTLGTGTLDATATATYTATSLNATTYAVTASYGGDTVFSSSVSAAQNLVVAVVAPTVTLTAPATAAVGASVTLGVTVSGTGGTPTGTVTFKDGTATLSTATLASGSASFTTTALAVGAHTITVSYSGDSVFGAATSAASTVTISVASAITFAAQPTTLTIVHGSTGSIVIIGTPVGGYTGNVTFACGTLPAGATCTFAPASLVFSGANTAQSSTLTFGTVTTVAYLETLPGRSALTAVFAAFLVLPLGVLRRRKLIRRGMSIWLALLIVSSGAMVGLTGCSSAAKSPTSVTTAVGSYTVPVTVTAGAAVSTLNVTVVVQ